MNPKVPGLASQFPLVDFRPFPNFDSAARAILQLLHERLGFALWMVTRVEGDSWIVLQSEDHGYRVEEGTAFSWNDSFCSQMVLGRGPCIAPRSAEISAYASAPIGRQVTIGAYIGVPLWRDDGSLFGTLCAIDPAPQSETIVSEFPLIQMYAKLLCTILEADFKMAEHVRNMERVQAEALMDSLTGLYNRRGWDQLLAGEESRCRRYGHPACVLSIDLDELKLVNDSQGHAMGDELICRAAAAIQASVREQDIVARIGGDEFVVLGIECDPNGSLVLQERVAAALSRINVQASMGYGMRDPKRGLVITVEEADQAMYVDKKMRSLVRAR